MNLTECDTCPECGEQWSYMDDGRRLTHLIGIYDPGRDRTVAWRCPACAREWPRGFEFAPVPPIPQEG